MTSRLWMLLGLGALVAGLLTGCGSAQQELPPVPGIDDARDARGVDPCGLLDTRQIAGLGFAAPGAATAATEGPRCDWRGAAKGGEAMLAVTLYTGGDGLATLAANSEPTTTRVRVSGYPALETFTGKGEFCQYDVGVADRQVLIAALDAPAPGSCDVLQSVVPMAVGHLPPYPGTPR